MRVALVLVLSYGCSFTAGKLQADGGTVDAGSGLDAPMIDAPAMVQDAACNWALHFDSCMTVFPTGPVTFSGIVTINTMGGGTTAGAIAGNYMMKDVTQPNGVHALLFLTESLQMSGTVILIGDKPIIFAAATTINSSALIDASSKHAGSNPAIKGPGSGIVKCTAYAASPGTGSSQDGGGGGGGGFHGLGGHGGDGQVADPGGAGGDVLPQPPPNGLRGGCPGADGSKGTGGGMAGAGGDGGGGVELAAKVSISLGGSITAGGAGGLAGGMQHGGGGGGGTGGVISLDSAMITILAGVQVAANGGGGGGGGGTTALAGQDGPASGSRALGGIGSQTGGQGGAGTTLDGEAITTLSTGGGGGGGGATGYILLHGMLQDFGATFSPAATPI